MELYLLVSQLNRYCLAICRHLIRARLDQGGPRGHRLNGLARLTGLGHYGAMIDDLKLLLTIANNLSLGVH